MLGTCMSCKSKISTERCTSKTLRGLEFCGKHVRVKNPRLWHDVNNIVPKITKITKIWRGYSIRKQLELAGPGVLKRSLCHNDEELVSGDEKDKLHPLLYFAFEENNKVWWFDIRTLCQCLNQKLHPENPYTRQPLTIDVRKRLRSLYNLRQRSGLPIKYDTVKPPMEILCNERWMRISQIIEENGFYDINPQLFTTLNRTELYILLMLMIGDCVGWVAEHKGRDSRRTKYLFCLQNLAKKRSAMTSQLEYSYCVSGMFLSILNDCVDPYTICFMIMSAMYRL